MTTTESVLLEHANTLSTTMARETGINASFAHQRAWDVLKHYVRVLAPLEADDASVAPDSQWHGTRNLAPRAATDDAWRTRVTVRHLNALLAREREGATPDAGDYAARRVAVHYRIKNAPWV